MNDLPCFVCQAQQSPFERFGHGAESLAGLLFALNGLFISQIGFSGQRTGPDEGVAKNGSLKELLIIFENFFGGLAEENLVIRSKVLGRTSPVKRLFP